MKTENTNKKKAIIIIALVLLAIIGISLLAVSCTAEADGGMEQAMTAVTEEMTDQLDDESGQTDTDEASQSDVSIDAEPNTDENSTESAAASEAQPSTSRQDAANANTTTGKPAASSGNSSTSPTPSKHWVEDTQRVWVEDRAAWTEQVPVYSTKEVSICNVCGQDITGNTSAHAKAHMMAGEGSGHHSEVRKTISGYNTVNHPAEGHYETKVVGGHWE